MYEAAQRPSGQWSLEVNLFLLYGFESYYKFMQEKKKIDICCVGRGMKCHSLSYWLIVMTLVEFSTGEFHAKQV